MKKFSVWAVIMASTLLVTACGDNVATETPTATTGTTTTTPTTTTTTTTTATGVTYTITVSAALATLSAGGTTAVTATIYADGAVDTTQVTSVTFTSSCVQQAKATMDSPVVSSAGVAVSAYKDVKCASTDTLSASASIDGKTITASTSLIVQAAAIGSISFVSATPGNIGIKGVGLVETSVIQFQVMDVNGQTAPANQAVNFSLDSTTGGITIAPTSSVTDNNGLVTTTVTSGTVPGTVRVTAVLASNSTIQTQSDGLVISTGISDQDSFSLAATVLNPEGAQFDGETSELTIRAADHFNNPVPDGAAVYFTTEGGSIASSCVMSGGACAVTWTSQNPRPADGRVTILASMTGEESFTDLDGDNRYDDTETFGDLPEAWRDDNENGIFDAGLEIFRDFNSSGNYTPADTLYNGALCAGPTRCGTAKLLDVRESIVLVMSTSNLVVRIWNPTVTTEIGTFNVAGQATAFAVAEVCDLNGQMPPMGTKITVTSDNGIATLTSGGTVPNSSFNGCHRATFSVKGDTNAGTPPTYIGSVYVTAKTPKGIDSVGVATVND